MTHAALLRPPVCVHPATARGSSRARVVGVSSCGRDEEEAARATGRRGKQLKIPDAARGETQAQSCNKEGLLLPPHGRVDKPTTQPAPSKKAIGGAAAAPPQAKVVRGRGASAASAYTRQFLPLEKVEFNAGMYTVTHRPRLGGRAEKLDFTEAEYAELRRSYAALSEYSSIKQPNWQTGAEASSIVPAQQLAVLGWRLPARPPLKPPGPALTQPSPPPAAAAAGGGRFRHTLGLRLHLGRRPSAAATNTPGAEYSAASRMKAQGLGAWLEKHSAGDGGRRRG